MINKKLITYATRAKFNTDMSGGLIPSTSIVFIQDTGELWTHNKFFGGNFSSVNTNYGTLTLSGSYVNLSLDGHKHAYTDLTGSTTTANLAIVSNGTANGWTLATLGSNAFNSTAYLPLSGGTMTGALNFKNGTWNNVGDNVAIGDMNSPGRLCIKAISATNPGIAFYNNSSSGLGYLDAVGSNLLWSGYTILNSSNFNSFLYPLTYTLNLSSADSWVHLLSFSCTSGYSGSTMVITVANRYKTEYTIYIHIENGKPAYGTSSIEALLVSPNGDTTSLQAGYIKTVGDGTTTLYDTYDIYLYSTSWDSFYWKINSTYNSSTYTIYNASLDTTTTPTGLVTFPIKSYLYSDANSVSTTKLLNARTINGTSFDGTENITTSLWGTARSISIGGTSKSVNGSVDVTWTLSEISANYATTAGTASYANVLNVYAGDECIIHNGYSGNSSVWINYRGATGTGITEYNMGNGLSTGGRANVRANSFIGSLTGNADSATTATKITATSSTTTLAYLLGVTGTGVTPLYDPNIYITTTAGNLHATTFIGALTGTASNSTLFNNISSSYFVQGCNAACSRVAPTTWTLADISQYTSGFWDVTGTTWLPDTNWYWGLTMAHTSNNPTYLFGHQIASANSGTAPLIHRSMSGGPTGTTGSWYTVLDSHNYTTYTPSINGSHGTVDGSNTISIYAPTSQLSVQNSTNSYLIGSPSTTSISTVYSNPSVYMSGSTLYASNFIGTASNSSALGGKSLQNILEREYSGTSNSGDSTGWFRIGELLVNSIIGQNCIIEIHRSYAYANNEAYIFSISVAYNGNISITQLSGVAGTRLITKIRADWSTDGKTYIDLYIATSTTNNTYFWTFLGNGTAYTTWTPNPTLAGTAYEFITTNGLSSDKGITGSLTGTASLASAISANSSTTTQAYLLGVTASGTTPIYDPGIYITSTSGTLHATYMTATTFTGNLTGTATNADLLDGYHELSFLRCDSSDASLNLNGNFAIGYTSDHNFIQSHSSLYINELGNSVYVNGGRVVTENAATWNINSTTSSYPLGFNGYIGTTSWGTLTTANGYILNAHWVTNNGSEISFGEQNGALSVQVDGFYYQNEGLYRVIDTNSLATALSSGTISRATHLLINDATWDSNWYWAGLTGLPTYIWGSNDGVNMYIWNPANFNVNHANSSSWINSNSTLTFGSNGLLYFNTSIESSPVSDNPSSNALPGGSWCHVLRMNHGNPSGYYHEIVADLNTGLGGQVYHRMISGGTNSYGWMCFLDSHNYNSYVPTLTGTGASGTWGISISGNAATATSASSATLASTISSNLSNTTQGYLLAQTSSGTTTFYDSGIYIGAAPGNLIATTFTGNLVGNASTSNAAAGLANTSLLWGQGFDGTGDVSGNISNTGNILPSASNTYTIGVGANYYSAVYASNFYGNLNGNANSATNIYVNYHSGNNVNYPIVWTNQVNTSNIQDDLLYKTTNNLYFNPSTMKLTSTGGFVGNLSGTSDYATYSTHLYTDGSTAGTSMTFHWAGLAGQPTWLWGGSSASDMYVYNPSNFSVNYATSSNTTNILAYMGSQTMDTSGTLTGGVLCYGVYNNGYPAGYGNVINIAGQGYGQLLIGWSGTTGAHADNYIRSLRDSAKGTNGWSDWAKILTSANYNTYALPLSGGTLTGLLTASAGIASTTGTFSSTLIVTGATTLSSTLGVSGATTISSTLGVSGLGTFSNGIYVTSKGININNSGVWFKSSDGSTVYSNITSNGTSDASWQVIDANGTEIWFGKRGGNRILSMVTLYDTLYNVSTASYTTLGFGTSIAQRDYTLQVNGTLHTLGSIYSDAAAYITGGITCPSGSLDLKAGAIFCAYSINGDSIYSAGIVEAKGKVRAYEGVRGNILTLLFDGLFGYNTSTSNLINTVYVNKTGPSDPTFVRTGTGQYTLTFTSPTYISTILLCISRDETNAFYVSSKVGISGGDYIFSFKTANDNSLDDAVFRVSMLYELS